MGIRVQYQAKCDGCGALGLFSDDMIEAIMLAQRGGWRVVERLLICPLCPKKYERTDERA